MTTFTSVVVKTNVDQNKRRKEIGTSRQHFLFSDILTDKHRRQKFKSNPDGIERAANKQAVNETASLEESLEIN